MGKLHTAWLLILTCAFVVGWAGSGDFSDILSKNSSGNLVCTVPFQCTSLGVGTAPTGISGDIRGTTGKIDSLCDKAGTAGCTFTKGVQTASGYGISIGGTASTTHLLTAAACGNIAAYTAPAGEMAIGWDGATWIYVKDDAGNGDLVTHNQYNYGTFQLDNGIIALKERGDPGDPADGWQFVFSDSLSNGDIVVTFDDNDDLTIGANPSP